jgi:hypothetical protein
MGINLARDPELDPACENCRDGDARYSTVATWKDDEGRTHALSALKLCARCTLNALVLAPMMSADIDVEPLPRPKVGLA